MRRSIPVVGALVAGLAVYALHRYRQRAGRDNGTIPIFVQSSDANSAASHGVEYAGNQNHRK